MLPNPLRIVAVLSVAAVPGLASASVVNFASNQSSLVGSSGVAFSGSAQWTATGANSGLLELTITNNSQAEIGGYLTGFAFNLGDWNANISLLSTNILDFVGVTNVSAEPFGSSYDAGAALGGSWVGGGRPQGGLAIGQTGMFSFGVTGPSSGLVSGTSIFEGPYDYDFVVRFRGLADGGSSKIAGAITSKPDVPAPGGAALMAAGLFVAGRRRRPASA